MSQKYSAFIYDWDGCLLDSLSIWIKSYSEILNASNIKHETKDLVAVLGDKDAFRKIEHPDPVKAKKEFYKILNNRLNNAELFPDALNTIRRLRELGARIFLATSSPLATFNSSVGSAIVQDFFDDMVFAGDVENIKPNPQPLNLLIDKFKLEKSEVIMVGDSHKDIIAAKNAEIDSLLFAPTSNNLFHDFNYLKSLNPTVTISKHSEILNFV